MRDFDFVSFEHDVLVGLGYIAQDVLSQLPTAVVAGFAATQTSPASLSINIGAGRIYVQAQADATAVGSIAQDTSTVVQQGLNAGQTLTLVAPSAGQSQWNLVQVQFAQSDAVRAGDPNGGVVPFYNASNPAVPNNTSINTVRKGTAVIQVVQGVAATTGSEIPPQPTGGWTPLYLIDLAGGQTAISTPQILRTGPSIGTGVAANYPAAPFIAGLQASHHNGNPGQAPKIDLTKEVTGILPYANMSPVRTLLFANLTLYVNASTGNDNNLGTSPSSAFATIQAALGAIYHNYDFNGHSSTVNVANGTYSISAANATLISMPGVPMGHNGSVSIIGNTASPGSCSLSAGNGNCVLVAAGGSLNLSGFTITAGGNNVGVVATAGYGVNAQGGSIFISSCILGSCGTVQCQAAIGGLLVVGNGCTFTGTTGYGLLATVAGVVWAVGSTITFNALTVTIGFACATENATIHTASNTFSGTFTGPRYFAALNGVVDTSSSANATYFPGSAAGITQNGGQYA